MSDAEARLAGLRGELEQERSELATARRRIGTLEATVAESTKSHQVGRRQLDDRPLLL